MGNDAVDVTIFGKQYSLLAGGNDEDYIINLASIVDSKMKELSSHLPETSFSGIAILACLNIADELSSVKKDTAKDMKKLDELITFLIDDIDLRIKEKNA